MGEGSLLQEASLSMLICYQVRQQTFQPNPSDQREIYALLTIPGAGKCHRASSMIEMELFVSSSWVGQGKPRSHGGGAVKCGAPHTEQFKRAVLDSFHIESIRRSQSCLDGDAKWLLNFQLCEEFPSICFTGMNQKLGVAILDAVLPQCPGSEIVTVLHSCC